MAFLYETHLHTSQSSACASFSGAQHARQYAQKGYAGIIITDHFYNGNTAVPRSLPWPEWVNRFYLGYEDARAEGEKLGLDVFFGWEERFGDAEFLIYGLDRTWLLAQPGVINWSPEQLYREVCAAGGAMVQAHPFRQAWYIEKIDLYPHCVHAVEGANTANYSKSPGANARAIQYAAQHGLPYTGGSDAHADDNYWGGMAFERRLKSIDDFVAAVKSGKGYTVIQQEETL